MYSFFKLSYSLNIFPLILFNWDSLNVSGMVCILNKKSNSQGTAIQFTVAPVNYPWGWPRARGVGWPERSQVGFSLPLCFLSVAKRGQRTTGHPRPWSYSETKRWLRCYRSTQAQV